MAQERKQLLIVDDSEVDRILLKSILAADFDLMEADSGNAAFQYITTSADKLDGILLDISMPHISGFDVLKFMADKNVTDIPVFLVTGEPTKDNVEKAVQYRVAEFIGKPFDRDDIIRRLRSRLGVIPDYDLRKEEQKATASYVADLEALYQQYLSNFGRTDEPCRIRRDLMGILLNGYSRIQRDIKLNANAIQLISRAAYFCDIGEMMIPDKRLQLMTGGTRTEAMQQMHTVLGSNLIRLNRAQTCEYFVEICSSMCLHHHERWDGAGYPHGLVGKSNSDFNQLCRIADEFLHIRAKFGDKSNRPNKLILKRLLNESVGMVSPKITSLLEDSEPQINDYFLKKDT